MEIYHNPKCSTSRSALQLLESKGINVEVILYMKDFLSKEKLGELIKKLKIKPEELVRKNEAFYKSNLKGKNLTDADWIDILHSNPKLIERPILVVGKKAVIGRPIERMLELLV